jgi:hypothetical protein
MARHGWRTLHPPDVSARRFWTIALGTALEGYATGRDVAAMAASMREALGEVAEARATTVPALRLAAASDRPLTKPR